MISRPGPFPVTAETRQGTAELHVHLEGTIRPETARELCARHGLAAPLPYRYSDLAGFLAVYRSASAGLLEPADFERVVLEHASAMAGQGIAYAEVSFNPSLHPGVAWVEGLVRGRTRAALLHGVEIRWLVELTREAGPAGNRGSLDLALSLDGVVGLGLVGDESIAASNLAPLVAEARAAGLRFMPHAGQTGGAASVGEALRELGAERIAHGVGAAADPSLLAELVAREVCLCVCPTSNQRIGLRPDFRALAGAGVALTANSDDPSMVGTDLALEVLLLSQATGLSRADLEASAWRHRFA